MDKSSNAILSVNPATPLLTIQHFNENVTGSSTEKPDANANNQNEIILSPEEKQEGNYFYSRDLKQVCEDGSKEKPRRKIAGAFLYEDTNTYFFSRTNYGKSLLAFQIGYSAATGTSIDPCKALLNECEPMKVLIIDLELDAQEINDRHKIAIASTNPDLIKNLIYNHEKDNVKPVFSLELLKKIEESAIREKAKLIIIDNISKLLPKLLDTLDVNAFIASLDRIRKKTGATFLVIGHTTKNSPKIAIDPTDFYGSSHLQNFFKEMFYLDQTKNGKLFLYNSKSKHKEHYTEDVPVMTLGDHPIVGTGFTFESIQHLSDIQKPLTIEKVRASRKISPAKYKNEIKIMEKGGIAQNTIATIFDVNRATICKLISE